MPGNTIHGKKQVEEAISLWTRYTEVISHTVDVLETYKKSANNLPSGLINSLQQQKQAQKNLNDETERTIKLHNLESAIKKEKDRLEKQSLALKAKLNQATSQEAQEIAKLRVEIAIQNKLNKQQAQLSSKLVSEYTKQSIKLSQLRIKFKDVALTQGENSKEAKRLISQITKLDTKLKRIDATAGQFGRNVGNYPKIFGSVIGAFKQLLPVLGIVGSVKFAFDFAKEARQLAIQAKGVEFAFVRLGNRGVKALESIKKSTRGLLSDLDIKTALVDFDNFNISLEETDVLFEFLAVRAAQTGKSIEELQSSLVEGLSKESKLRIDNLGIATADLNEELEKTPNFVQAVANIAKREVKEAGDILDDAGNSQEKWNAALDNFKLSVGTGFISKAANAMYDFGTSVLNAITPTKNLTNEIKKEQVELNSLVGEILKTNESEEERKILIEELTEQYPFFLKFIKEEKTDNDNLKSALEQVNSLYIKRLALQRFTERIDLAGKQRKLADETGNLAKTTSDYQKALTAVNLFVNRGVIDSNLLSKSLEKQNETLKTTIENEIIRLSQLKGQGEATDAQIKNLFKYENALNKLAEATSVFSRANSKLGFSETDFDNAKKEVEELEKALGITSEQMKELFNNDENLLVINAKLKKDGSDNKRDQQKTLLELFSLPTTEEAQEEIQEYMRSVLDVLNEAGLGLPQEINLPEIKIPLSQEKLDFYKKNFVFSDEEMDLIAGQFDELGNLYGIDASRFTALFDQKANTVDDYVLAAGEAMKGLYNSFANDYTADLERLRQNADTAMLFAGDSAAAQQEIKDQLAEKERQIRVKQAKEERDAALFNIFVNTATAVTQALPNIPLSIIVGAIGLANLAKVQSKEIPQFYDGTEDTGRGGRIDNRGGFNAVLHPNERVITKEQNKKMHGYSNDVVANIINEFHNKTLFEKELENMLNFNGILSERSVIPSVTLENNGLSKQDLSEVIGRLENTINSSERSQVIIDENGMYKFIYRGNQKTKVLNNVFHIKGQVF